MQLDVEGNTIFLARHGSHAYGTNIETSDLDIKGVCVPTMDFLLGFAFKFEQQEQQANNGHTHDEVVYSLQKFMKLAANCNPNIIEVLFADDSDILRITPAGKLLRDNRELFISKKSKHTFSGYAHAQLKRIKGHRAWLLDPPEKRPERSDFGLPDNKKLMNKSDQGFYEKLKDQNHQAVQNEDLARIFTQEKAYAAELSNWDKYQNWKKNRNPARAALEAQFGLDTKHGMHLIRLMRMCVEILSGDGVIVKRPDADELLDIRRGHYSYDNLIEEAEELEARCESLYESSPLIHAPDVHKLNALCIQIVNQHCNDVALPDPSNWAGDMAFD